MVASSDSGTLMLLGQANDTVEVWAFSPAVSTGPGPTSWTKINPMGGVAPPARRGFAAGYAPSVNQAVLFGGEDPDGTALSDFWGWDGSTWTDLSPTGPRPPARYGAGLAAIHDSVVLFGGRASSTSTQILEDTWVWVKTLGWSQITASPPTPARVGFTLLGDDSFSDLLLVSGVNSSGQPVGDTWRFDLTTWAPSTPAQAKQSPVLAVLPGLGHTLEIGGLDASVQPTSDVYDLSNAVALVAPGLPALLDVVGAVDPVGHGVVICGQAASAGQTWTLRKGQCDVATDCPTAGQSCVSGICCDKPCTGSCEECSTGTCKPAATGVVPVGKPGCSPLSGDAICGVRSCNGRDTECVSPDTNSACGPDPTTCLDMYRRSGSFCDGKGACIPDSIGYCGAYPCDSTTNTCATGCTSASDCIAGGKCLTIAGTDGICNAQYCQDLIPCTAPLTCQNNSCLPPGATGATGASGAGGAGAAGAGGTGGAGAGTNGAGGAAGSSVVVVPACDGNTAVKADGTRKECGAYTCFNGACIASCKQESDCGGGPNHCIRGYCTDPTNYPPAELGDATTCAVSAVGYTPTPPSHCSNGAFLLGFVAMASALSRRRSGQPPRSGVRAEE